jgi:hypothetical protein
LSVIINFVYLSVFLGSNFQFIHEIKNSSISQEEGINFEVKMKISVFKMAQANLLAKLALLLGLLVGLYFTMGGTESQPPAPPVDYQTQTSDNMAIIVTKVSYLPKNPYWPYDKYVGVPPSQEWIETRVIKNTPVEVLQDWELLRKNPVAFAKEKFGNTKSEVVSVPRATLYRAGEEPISC